MKKIGIKRLLLLVAAAALLVCVWLRGGLDKVYLDTDIGRDLSEISKLWIGQSVIWLGPRFSIGLHSSPLYYYLFYIPVLASGGSAYSIIIFNVFLAAYALFFLGYFSSRKYGLKGIIVPLVIGLLPWWQEIAIHPGNGFTYAIFLLTFLAALWFKLPLFLSSLLLGISLSMHPGAVFGLPLLIYELVKRKPSIKVWLLSIMVFIAPFTPLIAFEIITKGYWFRNWMEHPGMGMNIAFSIDNVMQFFTISGINFVVSLAFLILVFIFAKGREKVWFVTGLVGLFLFAFSGLVPKHYLFGVVTIVWFCISMFFLRKRLGRMALVLLSGYLIVNSLQSVPGISTRPVSKIEGAVNYLAESGKIKASDNLAVVSLKSADNKTPQADDYRFFLRVKGFNVEEVSDYANADKMILFVEKESLDWENWNSWETDQFGKQGKPEILRNDDIFIAVYSKTAASQ